MTNTFANTHPLAVNADNFAALTAPYPKPVRRTFALALKLFCGTLDIMMPDGAHLRFAGKEHGAHAQMRVLNPDFALRFLNEGDIGIAESFLKEEWDTPDLTQFLILFAQNRDAFGVFLAKRPLTRFLQLLWHGLNRNTRAGARRNILAHYDLGNAFYQNWLDATMTYSAAMFGGAPLSLEDAQKQKYEALIKQGFVFEGASVLEIGCGWGGFAEHLAKTRGCTVTALTISKSQYEYAKQRFFEAGLADKITLKLQDYRDERGHYDRVFSIEMFEAVGEAYWPTYFDVLSRRLNARGIAGLQIITIDEKIFPSYKKELDFIRAYIFPGGMLPTLDILHKLARNARLKLITEHAFANDYAKTLALWQERFLHAWPKIEQLGFDMRFQKLWRYYLSYCEAGFATERINVRQVFLAKG